MAKLTTAVRNSLPRSAFAQPAKRAYPLYTRVGNSPTGKLIPSPSHAANAKARAAQHAGGKLKKKIDAKANRMLYGSSKERGKDKKKSKENSDKIVNHLSRRY